MKKHIFTYLLIIEGWFSLLTYFVLQEVNGNACSRDTIFSFLTPFGLKLAKNPEIMCPQVVIYTPNHLFYISTLIFVVSLIGYILSKFDFFKQTRIGIAITKNPTKYLIAYIAVVALLLILTQLNYMALTYTPPSLPQ